MIGEYRNCADMAIDASMSWLADCTRAYIFWYVVDEMKCRRSSPLD